MAFRICDDKLVKGCEWRGRGSGSGRQMALWQVAEERKVVSKEGKIGTLIREEASRLGTLKTSAHVLGEGP
jgi:hypothetical protein